jgi:phosphoglycolate phosphatase
MIQKADSIIFDLDGTLWDSTSTVAIAWQKAINKLEFIDETITRERVQSITGLQYDVIFRKLFPGLTEQEREQLKKHCAAEELSHMKEYGGQLYEGLEETLQYLKKKYRLFIVSNCQSGYIEVFLEHHKMARYFEDFACFGDAEQPKAENIKQLIARNGLRAPMYVGDTQGDCDASAANNIPFIFASYGFGQADKQDVRIKQLSDMQRLM